MFSTKSYRTHTCCELGRGEIGESVRLSGWVHRKRDHGGLLFIDLRDHYGITQCVFAPESPHFEAMAHIPNESVICVDGEVVARPDDTENKELTTGDIEIQVKEVEVLSKAAELALPVFGEPDYPEDIRLAWRVLDLRRKGQHERIMLRQKVISSMRERMIDAGFMEFQTPILTAGSPEGARDFVVPSRLHAGKFYSLPQAPQMFKQLIMMGGFDRYFQIAPCFRDEDARADRSPGEFYQLDVEMSFVVQEDVLRTIEPILHGLFETFAQGRQISPQPFERITYKDALSLYGTDKPDLRNSLKIYDVSDCFIAEGVSFKAFRSVVEGGGVVRAIAVPNVAEQPRSFFDKLNDWARSEGAAGLGYIIFKKENNEGSGPIAKFIPAEQQKEIATRAGASAGSAVFFICDKPKPAQRFSDLARQKIARTLGLIDENKFHFCWIVDMPMFEVGEESGVLEFSHNPFSMPQGGLEALAQKEPLDILGYQYDIVCNGVELSSGAIRNHRLDILFKAFEIVGWSAAQVDASFPAMVRALSCGAPPHGGIAPGIDRIVMLLAGADNLRDVVMFPLNQQGEDLLLGAPAEIPQKHLQELHLKHLPPPKKP